MSEFNERFVYRV